MNKIVFILLLPVFSYAQSFTKQEINSWQLQAKRVTIIRDNWGVPHVYGKTEADCVFGVAYAQAEDNIEQVEDNFIKAIGKGSAIHGEESWISDRVVHAFEFVKFSKEEYKKSTAKMKIIYDAFAAGLNYYLYTHPAHKQVLLLKFEAWYPLAMIRHFYYEGILGNAGVSNTDLQQHFTLDQEVNTTGSNAWAIGPKKTGTENTMLFINPHRSIFRNGTFTEVHVESETGWKFSGTNRFGFPFPYMGHNGKISYGYTVNSPDLGDQYVETFDHATDSLLYKYGNGYRKAVKWNDTIFLKTDGKLIPRVVSFTKTHHGPIVKTQTGKPLSVRLSNIEKTGWFEQWYNMSKATDLTTFKKATSVLSFPYFNLVYADAKGNIYFLYSVAAAKRKEGLDWKKPVDGTDPETEWQGYHNMEELPQLLNPSSGYIQSCNSDIAFTAGKESINKSLYPSYMIGKELNNPRSLRSQKILSENSNIDFNRWAEITMDIRVQLADDSLDFIVKELKAKINEKDTANDLAPLVNELATWDHLASVNSISMTLFREMINFHRSLNLPFVSSLGKTKVKLEKLYGTWKVPWGELNRLQKIDWARKNKFIDNKASYPLPGVTQNFGTIFCITPDAEPALKDERKKRYHTFGSSYTSIIEMGKKVRAKSITCFGQQEAGPHAEDQAPLFANRQYKDAWFYKKDVLKHAERIYHPGE